jgi:hypothetical protein
MFALVLATTYDELGGLNANSTKGESLANDLLGLLKVLVRCNH